MTQQNNHQQDPSDTFRDDDIISIDDGSWDYYSGLPNPKWYDSDSWVDGDED